MFLNGEDMGFAEQNNQLLKLETFFVTCMSYEEADVKMIHREESKIYEQIEEPLEEIAEEEESFTDD